RGIGHRRAVVVLSDLRRIEGVARTDAVAILIVPRVDRADVAGVAEGVSVRVGLIGVGDRGAVVDGAADAVAVAVVGRIVAGPVAVAVGLGGVHDGGAVVVLAGLRGAEGVSGADPVPVLVVLGIEGARIAGIAERIAVGVRLGRVRDGGAVVAGVALAVRVG